MAVAYESDGGHVFANANNNNAVSITLPATRPVGSVLLFVAWCRLISAAAPAPSGYTLLSTHTSGTASGGRLWIYAKEVVGGETAPSVTPAGATGTTGDLWAACIYCYSGVDLSGGISAILDGTPTTQDASGTTTCTFPALTIASADSYIVRTLCRFRDAADTFTFTSTWAEREDASSLNRTGGQGFLQDKQATSSGSQATVTVAPSNTTAARYLGVTLALKKAATVHTGVSQASFVAGMNTAATATFKAVSQASFALGVVTAGQYVGRGVSQSTYAFGASTDGTVGAPGQSGEVSTSFVFGANTNGQLTRRGVSQSTYTAGIVTVGQKGRSGISQSTYTLGVQTVGTARPTVYGISQSVYTLGVATAGKYVARGNITTPLVLTIGTVGRGSFRGVVQLPIGVNIEVSGYTLEPVEILGGVTMGILVDISTGRGYSFAAMEEQTLEAPFMINPLFVPPPDNLVLTAMQEKTN